MGVFWSFSNRQFKEFCKKAIENGNFSFDGCRELKGTPNEVYETNGAGFFTNDPAVKVYSMGNVHGGVTVWDFERWLKEICNES